MIGLKKNQDFSRVYRKGRSKADRNIVVYSLKRENSGNESSGTGACAIGAEERRFGVSVSKKVGNSVVRHRIKRRLKEIFRLNEEQFPAGRDYVVIARSRASEADYAVLERSLLKLIKE